MNIKKILLYIFTIILIIITPNVFAYNSNVSDNLYLNSNSNYMYFGWTSETNYTSSQTMGWFSESQNLNESYQRAYMYITPATGNINDNNGFSIVFPNEQQFIANNNYNGAFVICSYGGTLPLTDLNVSVGDRVAIIEPSYYSTVYKFDTIDTGLVDDGQGSYFNQCKLVSFSFKAKNNGNYFAFRYRTSTNTSMGNYIAFLGSTFDYNGTDYSSYFSSLNNSIDSLNSNLNNNTQNVINNNTQNTQNIINNNTQNTQNLIDNQNDLTKGNCNTEPSKNKLQFTNGHTLDSGYNIDIENGVISIYGTPTNSNINYDLYIPLTNSFIVNNGENYIFSANNIGTNWFGNISLCDNSNNCIGSLMLRYENNPISNIGGGTYSKIKISIRGSIAVNSKLQIRPQLEYGQNKTDFTPFEEKEVCTGGTWGKLDEAENTRKGILGKIKDLFDFFHDDSDPNADALNQLGGLLPEQPVDSILNLPITLFQTISASINQTCQPLVLNVPFINDTLTLPCVWTLFENMNIAGFITAISVPLIVYILYRYLIFTYRRLDRLYKIEQAISSWGGV